LQYQRRGLFPKSSGNVNGVNDPKIIPRKEEEKMAFTREQTLSRLKKAISEGRPIIGGGAGTGISAKCEEAGGIDLIVIYNSGRFRMAGRGSLAGCMPYGDANAIVMEMANEVLPVVKKVPVLAGVCGTDPFRLMDVFLKEVKEVGFSGVQNFPTVGLCDGLFRQNLEETGMGFGLEVDMIRTAHEMDIFTTPYVFNVDEAKAMAKAGADVIVAHLGLTTKGSIGASTAVSLKEAPKKVKELCDAAKSVNPDVICLCHGGPIAEPEDAEYVLQNTTGIHGFYGASSMERLPTEVAIKEQTAKFKRIKMKK
jgi:predicted TIM-barrel enzyme